jgi:hypothetical protein
MKYWGRSENITSKTLQLLSDLSVGYSSVRKLIKLDAVQFILNNHTVSLVHNQGSKYKNIMAFHCIILLAGLIS